jgi:hypothetical protein
MNEEELKAIWKKNENISLGNIDFNRVKLVSQKLQKNLRRKIRWDVAANVLIFLLTLFFCYHFPKLLLLTPFYVAVWWWYLWEMNRLYKIETDFQSFANLKEFLQRKQTLLCGYIKRSRMSYLIAPFFYWLAFGVIVSFEAVNKNLFGFFMVMILTVAVIVILIEAWLWFVYRSSLDETEDLLRQLDTDA